MSIHAASGDVNCLVAMSQWHFAAGAMDGSLRLVHAERGAPCAVRRHSQASGPVLSLLFLRRVDCSLPSSQGDSPLDSPQVSSRVSTPRSPMTRARSDPSEDLPSGRMTGPPEVLDAIQAKPVAMDLCLSKRLFESELSSGCCRHPPTSCASGMCRPSWRMWRGRLRMRCPCPACYAAWKHLLEASIGAQASTSRPTRATC